MILRPLTGLAVRFLALGGLKDIAVCFLVPLGLPTGLLHAAKVKGIILDADEAKDFEADWNDSLRAADQALIGVVLVQLKIFQSF